MVSMKKLIELEIDTERVELTERKTGKKQIFIMRPFRYGDEEGVMNCVRDEYGDSYFKKFFYDKEKLRAKVESGGCDIFVAEVEGGIGGIEILSYSDCGDTYIEPASQILNHRYRGYGLSKALVDYTFRIIESMEPTSIFVHAVTFHDMTQKTCQKKGMIPVGFRIGSFLAENMFNSYQKKRCEKYSEGILIKPVQKKDAGLVYLPAEIIPFGKKVYDKLGVQYNIASPDVIRSTVEAGEVVSGCKKQGKYITYVDEIQLFVRIQVEEDGLDLKDYLESLVDKYKCDGKWSIQVALFTDTPLIYKQYEELRKLKFFFTGIKPLCSEREQLYMQWVGDWKLYMEDYILTEEFQVIREDIQSFYERR